MTFSLDDSWCAHKFADYKVVLLTNDNANKEKASLAGLLTFTMRQYVESLSDYPELVDKLSQAEEGNTKVYMYMKRTEQNTCNPFYFSEMVTVRKCFRSTCRLLDFMLESNRENWFKCVREIFLNRSQ